MVEGLGFVFIICHIFSGSGNKVNKDGDKKKHGKTQDKKE
jgi:hypothetical protein